MERNPILFYYLTLKELLLQKPLALLLGQRWHVLDKRIARLCLTEQLGSRDIKQKLRLGTKGCAKLSFWVFHHILPIPGFSVLPPQYHQHLIYEIKYHVRAGRDP